MNPEPNPTALVCTVCGLAWDKHETGRTKVTKANPVTLDDCVRVLKAELASRPRMYANTVASAPWQPFIWGRSL